MKYREAVEIMRAIARDVLFNEISRDEQAGELLFALAIDWEPDDPYLIGPIFTLSFDAKTGALRLFNHESEQLIWLTDSQWSMFNFYIYMGVEKRNLHYITLEDYSEDAAEVEHACC